MESSCSDLNNTVRSRSQERRRGSATLPRINVALAPRPRVFRTMERRHRKFKQAVFLLHVRPTILHMTKIMQLHIYCACARRPRPRALDAPRHVTILISHFLGGAKLRLSSNTVKKEQRQVNKKFCELKGGNIGIVEKAQETRFGMSPKYSRYIGIAS